MEKRREHVGNRIACGCSTTFRHGVPTIWTLRQPGGVRAGRPVRVLVRVAYGSVGVLGPMGPVGSLEKSHRLLTGPVRRGFENRTDPVRVSHGLYRLLRSGLRHPCGYLGPAGFLRYWGRRKPAQRRAGPLRVCRCGGSYGTVLALTMGTATASFSPIDRTGVPKPVQLPHGPCTRTLRSHGQKFVRTRGEPVEHHPYTSDHNIAGGCFRTAPQVIHGPGTTRE